jgi:hypothetical protein
VGGIFRSALGPEPECEPAEMAFGGAGACGKGGKQMGEMGIRQEGAEGAQAPGTRIALGAGGGGAERGELEVGGEGGIGRARGEGRRGEKLGFVRGARSGASLGRGPGGLRGCFAPGQKTEGLDRACPEREAGTEGQKKAEERAHGA